MIDAGKAVVARSYEPSFFCNTVYGQVQEGTTDAISYLLQEGCTKIIYFGGSTDNDAYEAKRFAGYADAHKNAEIPLSMENIRFCDRSENDAYLATKQMLREGVAFDAIFSGTDIHAFGIMLALNEAGLTIPDDVLIIGSDDLPESKEQFPPLASVRYPMFEIGEGMGDLLVNAVKNFDSSIHEKALPCEFIRRKSCMRS